VGFVLQDDSLFSGSIADNISFAADVADLSRVEECARLACLHDDIMAMPMGYGTLVGEAGSALSGGQQQRLLLARALYSEPSILILDEATSHLDVETERRIAAMLAALKITRVFAAHRPETVAIADRVFFLARPSFQPFPGEDSRRAAACISDENFTSFGSRHDPKAPKEAIYVEP
jgi:ATP-binding cassette, subfamily B, bacterial CvaB/MchF/RaxB